MYSRYKVEQPSPPPDYAGTAFASNGLSTSSELPVFGESSFSPKEPISPQNREGPPKNPASIPPDTEKMVTTPSSPAESSREPPSVNASAASFSSLFDDFTTQDLLFFGAMLCLLVGKAEDDSILLLSYLLTCGL